MKRQDKPSGTPPTDVFKVGDRVVWHAKWLLEKRTGTVSALHRPGTYILDLDQPLPEPHRGSRTVAFSYELDALSEIKRLRQLDPGFERFMRVALAPLAVARESPQSEERK